MIKWHFCQSKSPALSYWLGCLGLEPAVYVYELDRSRALAKDWLISAVGPKGEHAGLSLFHVPYTKAIEEATTLVKDLWGIKCTL